MFHCSPGGAAREAKQVKILTPDVEDDEIVVGPALFGPDLGRNEFQASVVEFVGLLFAETAISPFILHIFGTDQSNPMLM